MKLRQAAEGAGLPRLVVPCHTHSEVREEVATFTQGAGTSAYRGFASMRKRCVKVANSVNVFAANG